MEIDGRTLLMIRTVYNLTQAEMGALCEVTDTMINKIERGSYGMTDNIRKAIRREFRLSEPGVYERISAKYNELAAVRADARARIMAECGKRLS